MVLPHGALICGEFIGDILCERGTVIITKGARIRGRVEADRIYVEGEVSSGSKTRSILMGRQLIAGGSTAKINADLFSRLFALHKCQGMWGRCQSFEEAEAARLTLSVQAPAPTRSAKSRTSGTSGDSRKNSTAPASSGSATFRDSSL